MIYMLDVFASVVGIRTIPIYAPEYEVPIRPGLGTVLWSYRTVGPNT